MAFVLVSLSGMLLGTLSSPQRLASVDTMLHVLVLYFLSPMYSVFSLDVFPLSVHFVFILGKILQSPTPFSHCSTATHSLFTGTPV